MNYHKKANITLGIVTASFIIAAILEHTNPQNFGIRLVYFVLEAALVGGIADWFAVTAIFRKPLGWGFHTALIPRNREKLIGGIASMVQSELLRPELIGKKLETIAFTESILNALAKRGGPEYLSNKLLPYVQNYLNKQQPEELAGKLADYLRREIQPGTLRPMLIKLKDQVLTQGYLDQGMDRLADKLWDRAASGETRQILVGYMEEIKGEKISSGGSIFRTLMGLAEMSDGLNIDEAAEALQIELLLALRKLKDREDPLRAHLKGSLITQMTELVENPGLEEQLRQWKNAALSEPWLEEFLEDEIRSAIHALTSSEETSRSGALPRILCLCIEKFQNTLQENETLRKTMDGVMADLLYRILQSEHRSIGITVRETLEAYTDQELNRFVQEKAGNDLQWIRINGSMIGGLVGLVLFLILEFLYQPFIMPIVSRYIL